MTEEEWLSETNPRPFLDYARTHHLVSDRKLRLIACAFARLVWDQMADPRSRRCVELAERHADGLITAEKLRAAHREAIEVTSRFELFFELDAPVTNAASATAANGAFAAAWQTSRFIRDALPKSDGSILREVIGNPFRPVAIDPAWRTSDVVALARGIYEERAFDRMPILADALQDAGCDNDDVLNHCRGASATHVRGCWVVDLILGKE